MASPIILRSDRSPTADYQWQLLKSPSGAQTILTAAQLSQCLTDVNFTEATVEFLDVERYRSIRMQLWGVAADTNTATIQLYGWADSGPGSHLAQLTVANGPFTSAATTGFHASAKAHPSIRAAFLPATAYRSCDTYTIALNEDYEQEVIRDSATPVFYQSFNTVRTPSIMAGTSPLHADFPSHVMVDFSHARWKYFGVIVTALTGTSEGAIFKPAELW